MQDELVSIYAAPTIDDAERLADKLEAAGIEAFVDATDAPLYGATRGPRSRVVQVWSLVCEHAKPVVQRFQRRWHEPLEADEQSAEEPAIERPDRRRLSSDDANGGVDHFTEAMQQDAERLSPEARAMHRVPRRHDRPGVGGRAMLVEPAERLDAAELPPDTWR